MNIWNCDSKKQKTKLKCCFLRMSKLDYFDFVFDRGPSPKLSRTILLLDYIIGV